LVIDTNALPVRDRFDVWRDAFSDVHDVVVESGISADFRASCRNFAVRETVFGMYKTPARRVVRTTRHLARHDVDHLAVRVSLSGNIKGRQREQDYHVCPGGIAIGTFAYGYEEVHTAGSWATAILPRSSLPHFSDDGKPRVVNGVRAALLRDILLSFSSSLSEATGEDLLVFEDVLRRVLESILLNKDSAVVADDLRLKRIDDILRTEMGSSRLTAARVCELTGISRTTLYRLFRGRGGVEVHLTGMRLDSIRRDLEAPALSNCSISRIAENRGMHNVSAFNRAFQRRFGCTPSDVRQGVSLRRTRMLESETGAAHAPGSFLQLLK
jgi:AraC-like DNA-binding protein